MCRELLLVVLGGDDESLAGVGGEPHVHLLQVVRGAVGDLRRREVEVAELARAHHQDVRAVGAGGDARQAHLGGRRKNVSKKVFLKKRHMSATVFVAF